jgi:hypothetical protein
MFDLELSPSTLIILPLAIFLDVAGILLLCCSLDDFGILDIIGIFFIDTWLFFQGSRPAKAAGGIKNFIINILTGDVTKYVVPTAIELTPGLGCLSPTWTITVLCNLSRH